jgi:hypothetical protein
MFARLQGGAESNEVRGAMRKWGGEYGTIRTEEQRKDRTTGAGQRLMGKMAAELWGE